MLNGKTAQQLEAELAQFSGTENYFRYWSGLTLLTDGVKYLADQTECHWLLDAIGSYQADLAKHPDPRLQEMQFWTLEVAEDESANLTCVADADEPPAVHQHIPYTDFPLRKISVWVACEGRHKIALLPSEY